jgi:hypothetical protein
LLHKVPESIPLLQLYFAFYLQIIRFRAWACLDSNQGPLPYQRQLYMLWMFTVVQKYLQIPAYYFYAWSGGAKAIGPGLIAT